MPTLIYHFPVLSMVIPLVGAFIIPLLSTVTSDRRVFAGIALTTISISALLVWSMAAYVFTTSKPIVYIMGGFPPPVGITYYVDEASALMASLVGFVGVLVVIYTLKYLEEDYGVNWFYILMQTAYLALLGLTYTADLFHMFVLFEVTCISTYMLVAFRKDKPISVEAATKYALISVFGTGLYYFGVWYLYNTFGTLSMPDLVLKLMGQYWTPTGAPLGDPRIGITVFVLTIIVALGILSATAPFHWWLPDVYTAAPAAVAALFSGAKDGVMLYLMMRILFTLLGAGSEHAILPFSNAILGLLLMMGLLSALLGSLFMLAQTDVKRFISWCTINHVGLIVVGIGLGLTKGFLALGGVLAAVLHILNHGIIKSELFMCTGCFTKQVGTQDMMEMKGIIKAMPVTASFFLLGCIALIGIPGFAVFWDKFVLLATILDAANRLSPIYLGVLFVLVITMAIEAFAYLRVIQWFVVSEPTEKVKKARESSPVMIIPITIMIAVSALLFLMPSLLLGLASKAASALLNQERYVAAMEYYMKLLVHH